MKKEIPLSILFFISCSFAYAQLHPVQITPQLVPPYAVYLTDYATPGNEKLRLVVLQRDVTKPFYQIRLQLSVELNGSVIMKTSPAFRPAPITVDPGAPVIISGTDLQPYLDSRNLDFSGISREEYDRTKALPEGNYQICFTAYDYNRQDVAVSQTSCNFFWLAKSEPPLLNFPACGTALPMQTPQQIVFSWMPRNTASANSADNTEYEFNLYETRPAGRNPNDVVLSSQPIYRTTTPLTQMMYSAAEPLLLENMTYVWRVKAIDKSGRDLFRNNGYSEVCTFTYGTVNSNIQLKAVAGLAAQAEAERRAKATWTTQEAEGYKIYYRKSGSANQWFSQDAKEAAYTMLDLEADTDYETRVLAYVGAAYGPYSDIVKFKTPKKKVAQCGDALPVADTVKTRPIAFVTQGMVIDVQGIALTISEAQGPKGDGVYAGKGQVTVPYLGASFNVTFKDLFITENHTASRGRIDFITRKVDEWIEDEIKKQKEEELAEKQEENRETWKDTDFYDKIIYYNDDDINGVTASDGQVVVTTEDGKTMPNPQITAILKDAPGKAIIIEDKNGDQWVVQKDRATGETKVTKVEGGGLSPTYNIHVSDDALALVKKALISLRTEYTGERMQTIIQDLKTNQKALDDYNTGHNPQASNPQTANTDTDTLSINGQKVESLFFDFVEVKSEDSEDEFTQIATSLRQKERERNRGLLLQLLGNDANIATTPDLVAREMKIDDKTVSDYLDQARQNGADDQQLLVKTKASITALIDALLIDLNLNMTDEKK
jgi:TANFOR domain-containing protein